MKKIFAVFLVLGLLFCLQPQFCLAKEVSKEEVIVIATDAVKAKGLDPQLAQIIYDEEGKLWCETAGIVGFEDTSPNHGILKKGFLKNYKIVFFDFKEPVKDVWVFVDKDTGEILTVYQVE